MMVRAARDFIDGTWPKMRSQESYSLKNVPDGVLVSLSQTTSDTGLHFPTGFATVVITRLLLCEMVVSGPTPVHHIRSRCSNLNHVEEGPRPVDLVQFSKEFW